MDQRNLFGLTELLEVQSEHGDPPEALDETVDSECFRGWLVEGLGCGDRSTGGRLPFEPVSMFSAVILQAQHNLSDARMELMIRGRLSWMWFPGFEPGGPTPDENTIRLFRDKLTESGALKRSTNAFDWQLRKKGYILPIGDCRQSSAGQWMSGQIVDASLAQAQKDTNAPLVVCAQTTRGGIGKAEAKLMLPTLAYNMDRLIFHERGGVTGRARRSPEPPAKPPGHRAAATSFTRPPQQRTGVDAGFQVGMPGCTIMPTREVQTTHYSICHI